MDPREYYTPNIMDYDMSQSFMEECRNTNLPVAVVGNGGSLNTLTTNQITHINNSRLFRCNWAFEDPGKIKKEYALYFSQAYKGSEESNLRERLDNAIADNKVTIYRSITDVLYNYQPMCSLLSSDKIAVWPTSGIQMLLYASFMIKPSKIYIAGIDMYTYKRDKLHMTGKEIQKYLKQHGKTFGDSPEKSAGIGFGKDNMTLVPPDVFVTKIKKHKFTYHNYESDILLAMYSFAQCYIRNIKVSLFQCDILSHINELVIKNIDTVQEYFKNPATGLTSPEKFNKSYNMWRFIHNTTKQVLPD
jgi:hypothetical protein